MNFISIQYLRAVAAIAVVIFHVQTQTSRLGYTEAWPLWLASGVDIFFVISGFIMVITTSNRKITPMEFYRRRLVRIAPLYWTLTAFLVLVQLISPAVLQSSRFDTWHVVASFLFIPSLHPVLLTMEPVLVPGWTLNYEMFFYLIFGAGLLLQDRYRVIALLAALLLLSAIGFLVPASKSPISYYTSTIVLEFGFGAAIAWLYLRGFQMPAFVAWGALCIGVLGLMLWIPGDFARAFRFGIPAALVVAGAVWLENQKTIKYLRIPHFLGDASYSIYLSHGIVLSALGQLWRRMHIDFGGFAMFSAVAVSAACIGGCIVYICLERPLMRALTHRRMPEVPLASNG